MILAPLLDVSGTGAALLLLAMVATVPVLVVGLHRLTDVIGGILFGVAVSVPPGVASGKGR
jgi:hypothetical protein